MCYYAWVTTTGICCSYVNDEVLPPPPLPAAAMESKCSNAFVNYC